MHYDCQRYIPGVEWAAVPADSWPDSRLGRILEKLQGYYGRPKLQRFDGPLEMILWEMVAYLAEDARRGAAFEALRERVGLTPDQILAAPKKTLCEVTRMGGAIAAEERAERIQAAARIVRDEFGGDLTSVLKMPPLKAKKALMRFPMIGDPGAEKILLFSGALAVLALDSNGVRVMTRLGFGEDRKSYSATYKSIREASAGQLPENGKLPTRAHLLLRRHGQELCLRNGPACGACPVRADCAYFQRTGLG